MLVGRKEEIKTLKQKLSSSSSELIAIYGRRRVGKTYLVRETYKSNLTFELTGLHEGKLKDQLKNFHTELVSRSKSFENYEVPDDWFTAFQLLEKFINRLRNKKKKVIFIDEFPWIAGARSKFLMAFEHFWNTYCTRRQDLVVVICGSAASFMVNKIIKNKGGLHNRLSCKIRLMPFNLYEANQLLKSNSIHLNNYDILQLYMAIGGIPYYLGKVNKGESVTQNIDRLCFSRNGFLIDEFDEIFVSLFSNSTIHQTIIRALSKTRKGVTRKNLLELCHVGSGGVFSKTLHELIESGFVSQYLPFGKKSKDSLFRLTDEYSLFYLKFIEPNRAMGDGTWIKLSVKQTYKSWSGFAFETVCLKHVQQIKRELGVEQIYSVHSSWHNDKAQVDLVIDRDDGIINLCEMKFYQSPFSINRKEYATLRNKILQFKSETKTRKNIFLTLITTYGITENANSLELVSNSLTMDCLFEE